MKTTEKKALDLKKGSALLSKSAEAFSGALSKTTEIGKKVVLNTQVAMHDISEKNKNDRYQRELRKYNPLFPGDYASENFNLPNIIMIRDDAERRNIEVCKGAIGWLEKGRDNVEIFYIYDEFVPYSNLQFIPAPECDAIHFVDHFDRTKFIRTDIVFNKAHEEKMAELRNIAFCLGAKSCSIEISESTSESDFLSQKRSTKEDASVGVISAKASAETTHSTSHTDRSRRSGHSESSWSGEQEITRPELKWFRHEETILKLIETCLSGNNHIKSEMLLLEGSAVATMSQKAAMAVDAAMKKGVIGGGSKNTASMQAEASRESRSKLIFRIEF